MIERGSPNCVGKISSGMRSRGGEKISPEFIELDVGSIERFFEALCPDREASAIERGGGGKPYNKVCSGSAFGPLISSKSSFRSRPTQAKGRGKTC